MATNNVEDTFPTMATNNVEALAEITQSLIDEEIVELIPFNAMVQIKDHWGIVNLYGMLEEYSKKVHMSVTLVRLCLTGDLEDLDVAKSALGTLERDNQMFESQIRKFIELKKQVYLFDRAAAAKSQPESSKQGEDKGKKE
uniref:Uncharacterized protein n=1 Tax=Lactuca sativa TaxID=4236 RepID=A0A9R1X8I5_LACSA|nr:hypothetical protein LSAT_V11C500281710 [Lactuca sativa]